MSSSTKPDLSSIPLLTGQSNYREWSLEVKSTAQLGGFWKAILGTNNTTSTESSEIDKFDQREEKAIGLIAKTVSSTLKVELSEYQVTDTNATGGKRDPTAKEMWEYLQSKFEKKSEVSAIIDLGLLTQTKLIDDGTLENQLNTMQDVRSRCALNEIKFEDWQYAALILLALPETYKHITDSFLATDSVKDLNPSDVRAKAQDTRDGTPPQGRSRPCRQYTLGETRTLSL
ncbi:hypothetical protein BDM02DRAFT_3115680 [Thelephora ganbajun]|uniref:Uncharacterized protein n=1 Tax=Thelephora ganbajun TaxID=370292 RepID=A0ACB6ZF35_THEGA|nr:hypothetical protein BDM02DRAFT_3115680 [Thelephora ganbajun]